MTIADLDEDAAGQVKPGDTVLIRGTVMEAIPGVGVRVELFSKTDQYEAWLRLDRVVALDLPDVPAEPGDGTWLVGPNDDYPYDSAVSVYHRHDYGAPSEPERRWARRWQVAGTGEWIDWPTAVHRGADPTRQLRADHRPRDTSRHALIRIDVDMYLRRVYSGTLGQITKGVRHAMNDDTVQLDEIRAAVDEMTAEGRLKRAGLSQHQISPRWMHNPEDDDH